MAFPFRYISCFHLLLPYSVICVIIISPNSVTVKGLPEIFLPNSVIYLLTPLHV
nr:MAG TPA: hypothetical protein [Caudoviricetes sp.]